MGATMELMIPLKSVPTLMLIDDCNYELIKPFKWFVNNRGYAASHIKGRYWLLHRFIMNLEHGNKTCVDHLNRNKLDNRVSNFRLCSRSENLTNKPLYKNSKSPFKGVDHRHGTRYRARIRVNKKIILLGTYGTQEEAAAAYDRAALVYIGPYAFQNFPQEKEAS